MTKPPLQADRRSVRLEIHLDQSLEALLKFQGKSVQHPVQVWDISQHGLGIWCQEEGVDKAKVSLRFLYPVACEISGIIVWATPSLEPPGYRIGIEVDEASSKMELGKLYTVILNHLKKSESP